MAAAVLWQLIATLVVAGLAAIFGIHAATSALFGGLACVLPSALFAIRLHLERRRPEGATVHGFFVGEFVKIAATLGLLVVVAKSYPDLVWPAMIAGVIAALKGYLLMFVWHASTSSRRRRRVRV